MARQNFDFYCKSKGGATVELFELPMILTACGYRVKPAQLNELADFLSKRKSPKISFPELLAVLTELKHLELKDDPQGESDEYVDAFVALGGQPDKSGQIEKNRLIEII